MREAAPSSLYRTFARSLLRMMGLGAATTIAMAPACGGKVVIDAAGQGGAGGDAATSTGSGPYICTPEGVDPALLVDACLDAVPQGGCPEATSSEVADALAQKLNFESCADFCCSTGTMTKVACGPDPAAQGCCYTTVFVTEELCMGRPFTVEGVARTAQLVVYEDDALHAWAVPLAPSVAGLNEAMRLSLGQAWAKDGLAEHASIASFARFARQLRALSAPAELIRDAEIAVADEVRHAEMCFGLASAYLGKNVGPSELPCDEDEQVDVIAIARAVVREGAIGETIAALSAEEAASQARDPVVRSVLQEIAKDEAEHAAIAWRFLVHALGAGDAAMLEAVREEIDVVCDAIATQVLTDVHEPPSFLREHGRLSRAEQRAIALRTLNEVILPCARELLVASTFLASYAQRAAAHTRARGSAWT